MARIEKGQSYPELGFRVDGKGIAYDLKTGASLAKAQVDARLQGSGMSQLGKKRGGVAGVWDRNKKVIVPLASAALGAVTGGVAAPILLGAAARGLDREGKSGVGVDLGQAARGAVEGGVSGYVGTKIPGLLSGGGQGTGLLTTRPDGSVVNAFGQPRPGSAGGTGLGRALRSGATRLGGLAKTAGRTILGGAKELIGGPDGKASTGDWLKAGLSAIPAIQGYNRARDFERQARTQVNTATQGNNTMAELAKALIARGGAAPSAGPDLSNLVDTRNPYYKKMRPMIGPPGGV
jgi:hypothetical protein